MFAGGVLVSVRGRFWDRSENPEAIPGSPLSLTWIAVSHQPVSAPMGGGMPCGLFGSNKSGGESLGHHMSIPSSRLHA